MDQRISGRDHLNFTLLASISMPLGAVCPLDLVEQNNWDGYGGYNRGVARDGGKSPNEQALKVRLRELLGCAG
jgi:hypothetical protein